MLEKILKVLCFGAILFIVMGLMMLPGNYPQVGAWAVMLGMIFTIFAGFVGLLLMWRETHG